MMTRGRSPDYARERVATHADRVRRLCDAIDAIDAGTPLGGAAVPPDATWLLAALDPADGRQP